MGKLKGIERKVLEILSSDPATRSSDDILYLRLCEKMGVPVKSMSMYEFLLSYRKADVPTLESVGRFRRKLQEKYEELKPTAEVKLWRKENEKSFYNYARGIK